jgi:serine/threonine-protein kinase RsbW
MTADDPGVEPAQLAVSELVTNAVRHGGATTDEDSIELRFARRGGRLRVSVLDRSTGAAPAPRTGGESGGWGLAIVEAVTRAWGHCHQDGRTVVWFEV